MPTHPFKPQTLVPCDNPRAYKWKKNICKCIECGKLASRENKQIAWRKANGLSDKQVPVEETRLALQRLTNRKRKSRLSVATISRYIKVTEESIWGIMRGDSVTVKSSIAKRVAFLASLSPEDPRYPRDTRRHDQVTTERAVRIIQGLMLQGYAQTWVAQQLGHHPTSQVSGWMRGKTKYISKENDARLLEIASEVGLRPGPSSRTRAIALRRGYKALAEWDDLL